MDVLIIATRAFFLFTGLWMSTTYLALALRKVSVPYVISIAAFGGITGFVISMGWLGGV